MAIRPPGDDEFGLIDPATLARWERESELIRVNLADERTFRRHRAIWVLLVGFLMATIAFCYWTIFATGPW